LTTLRNIELKARIADANAARKLAEAIATERRGIERQVDTYFHCRNGRLKLREIEGQAAQLIWYARPDTRGPKPSDYQIVPVSDAARLKIALTAALGTRTVIEKRREIFLWHNVRIHLDEVAGQGVFLEFEAVLEPLLDDTAGKAELEQLAKHFGIATADLVCWSYGEIAERKDRILPKENHDANRNSHSLPQRSASQGCPGCFGSRSL
jgi:predicted adenylyl cyclase CyaB